MMSTRKNSAKPAGLSQLNLNAAGIDVGATSHFVAVPADRAEQPVQEFAAFTADLYRLAEWLSECGVETVVMESTGVYWIPLFGVLEERGFAVMLVDPRRIKNVPGRKTDVLDCQWLQQLHTYGLLSGAFRPDGEIRRLRSYLRQRTMLVEYASHHIQHMQKALTQMNVKLQHVISNITGQTGMDIIEAIVGGERDPRKLAQLRNYRIKADEATIAKSLQGHWREEHIFELTQALELYRVYLSRVNYFCRLRQLVLPVHLLGLAALLGRAGAVAGHVKLQDDGVMHHPVNRRGGGHGVGEDALPLREDQVGRDAQRPPLVAFGDEGEEHLRLLSPLGQVAQVIEEQEVEVVQPAQLPGQGQVALGGEEFLHQAVGGSE